MVSLTWPSGQLVDVKADNAIRIRKTYPDYDGERGNSRVYWPHPDLFTEQAEEVVHLIDGSATAPLSSLTMPGGQPVWFKGKASAGPIYVIPTNRGEGCNSSFEVGGKVQYVRETPEEVARVIQEAGGVVKPIRHDLNITLMVDGQELSPEQLPVWDADLLLKMELPIPADNPFGISPTAGYLDGTAGGTNGPKGPQ